jgi:hypothetical protein
MKNNAIPALPKTCSVTGKPCIRAADAFARLKPGQEGIADAHSAQIREYFLMYHAKFAYDTRQVLENAKKAQELLSAEKAPADGALRAAIDATLAASKDMAARQKEVLKRTAPRCGVEEAVLQTFLHYLNNRVLTVSTRLELSQRMEAKNGRQKEAEQVGRLLSKAVSAWEGLGAAKQPPLSPNGPFASFELFGESKQQ